VPVRAQILPVTEAVRATAFGPQVRIDRIVVLPLYRTVQAIAHGRRSHAESVALMIMPGS
jgi:hypothetical protein